MRRHSISILLALALFGVVPIAAAQQALSSEQLDNLVAPVALYPDPLLGQILVASTYPLEIVEANQWLQRNPNLRGQELIDAAKQQPWDPSIQALVAIPDALAKLNEDIRWTTDLGNAFLSQQADVMNAVQRMRARAQDNGRLASTPQQTVTTQEQEGQQAIVIQPADPQVIYVPTYDPVYVWGPPAYGYYPPLFYPRFGFGFGAGFNLGLFFNGWGGWGGWGWGLSWLGRSVLVLINNLFFHHYGFHQSYAGGFLGSTAWMHDPVHRMNVPYASPQIAARFRGSSMGSSWNAFRSRSAALPYANRSAGRFTGRAVQPAYRTASPQALRFQNPVPQRYQPSRQYRAEPQTRQFQNSASPRYQPSRQYRAEPQTRRFQSQSVQRFQAPRQSQYHAAPRMSSTRFSGGGGVSRSHGGSISRGGSGSSSRGGGKHRR